MTGRVITMRPRPAPLAPSVPYAHTVDRGIEVVHYQQAAIHEGVPVTYLVKALASAGLTFTAVDGRGLVIHAIGQDPEKPADGLEDSQAPR